MKQIKIGFCGTHGSGKTTSLYTLASYLKQYHYDVDVVSEVARRCPYPINELSTIKTQLYIFSKMIENELMPNSNIILCDRTLLDVYAYTVRVDKRIADSLLPFIIQYIKTYDLIFYLSPKDYDINDGLRSTNQIFRNEIEHTFLRLMEIKEIKDRVIKVDSQKEINYITIHFVNRFSGG
jgi:GTPase SAR1 family protein